MRPTVRSASLVDYPEIAQSVGLDPYKMLERVGLSRSCLRNPDLRISADAVAELLEASASAARVDDFALRLAHAADCRTPRDRSRPNRSEANRAQDNPADG